MFVPKLLLRKLYTISSLRVEGEATVFGLKNRLSDASLTQVKGIRVNGENVDLERVTLHSVAAGTERAAATVTDQSPLPFGLAERIDIRIDGHTLPVGKHLLDLSFEAAPFGSLSFDVEDAIATRREDRVRIPRSDTDDYGEDAILARQQFIAKQTGVSLEHISHYSFDARDTQGNIENFTGVAQIPIGIAGPLRVNGEQAQGDFLVPMATTEGTLVASYNRGIKVLNLSGGVTVSVVADAMQRAPVFIFKNAREGRDFVTWIEAHFDDIAREAESTSSVAKLSYIDPYLSNKFVFLRFNYQTGDAAGQNMVGRATFAACGWINDHYEGIERFFLESNFATDKKASQVNIMRTRGKRVTAEATIPRDVLIQHMRVTPEELAYHGQVANIGSILSGANNNGLHSANAITAIYIATGQDVANVSEASAGILYTELTAENDLYVSLTIPSLIVATHGGGTGLPTQREALAMLGCTGRGKVRKFAEIVAGVALAGELSLAAAISSLDWVSSHEAYGRNR